MKFDDVEIVYFDKFHGSEIGENNQNVFLQIVFRLKGFDDMLLLSIEITPDDVRLYKHGVFTDICCYSEEAGPWDSDIPCEMYGGIYYGVLRKLKPFLKRDEELRFRFL